MNKNLDKLHNTEVEILDKIVEICNENDIQYFFLAGTLLGAVRHKGFIPWDDDVDIGMLRKDYEKFIDLCLNNNVLGDKYYLHCYESDPDYFIPFIKVKKNNTTFAEKSLDRIKTHKGIFVDIFPYDNVPKEKGIPQKIQAILIRSIYDAIYVKNNIYKFKNCRRKIVLAFFLPFRISTLQKINRKLEKIYNNRNAKYITCFSGTYGIDVETVLKSKIFPLKKVEFEGKKYNGFNDNDYYLKKQYGDYMTLPPIEKRQTHLPTIIDFNKGECRINENKENVH